MSRVPTRSIIAMVTALGVVSAVLQAQTGVATGTVRGLVSEVSGKPLIGVTVTAINTATGLTRSQETDEEGRFELRLLPPGEYVVRAALQGFAAVERQGVFLGIGGAPFVHLRLELVVVDEVLLVTGELPPIETTRASLVDTVEGLSIAALPSNGRDFKDLMILSPQVGESEGRPTVAGGEGMMNLFNVDGADSNSLFFCEQLGGAIPPFTYSRAAIREFQVLRSSYNVRFGGAVGGIVNAVTKSGTNRLQGGVFAFYQDAGMLATDALGAERDDFERRQLGLELGGPLRRDELHFFFVYDSQRRDQNALREPLGLAPALRPAFDARLASLGIDPVKEFDYVVTNDADVVLARLDWNLGDSHRLWLRHNASDQGGDNLTFGYRTSGWSNLGRGESRFHSTASSLTSVLDPSISNEIIVQYAPAERPREANFTSVPQTVIGFSDAVVGQGLTLPSSLDEDRAQLQDNLVVARRDHALHVGIDYSFLRFVDSFQLSRGGYYYLPTYREFLEEAPCSSLDPGEAPCIYVQAFSPIQGVVRYDTHLLSIYAGDEWRPRPRLTVEYGLRLEHQENPPTQNPNPLEPRTAYIPDDTNLAPRLGFACDVGGDQRSVLRGGIGLFHNWTPSLLVANAILGNGVNGSALFLVQGFSPLFPAYPNRLPPEAATSGGAPPNIFLFSPDFENPETARLSLGYERLVGDDLRLGAEVTYSRSRHRVRQRDVNLDPTPAGTFPDGRPIYGGPAARLDPAFGQILQITSDAKARYFSVVLSASRRYRNNWTFQANYTYSRDKDHDSAESENITTVAEDHYDLDQDWGWSRRDARHRIAVSGIYTAHNGVTLSLVGRYRDAYPIDALASADLNNDGFFGDRPGPDPGLGLDRHLRRNSFRGSSSVSLDLRLAKAFRLLRQHEIELIVEVFNLTNAANYASFDSQLSRAGQLNPDFGKPLQAGEPRLLQVGARYRF